MGPDILYRGIMLLLAAYFLVLTLFVSSHVGGGVPEILMVAITL